MTIHHQIHRSDQLRSVSDNNHYESKHLLILTFTLCCCILLVSKQTAGIILINCDILPSTSYLA